jgi:Calx-beta domain
MSQRVSRPLVAVLAVVALAALPAGAATYTVTNTNDSGPGSLRQALLDAQQTSFRDVIEFNIPSGGVQVIHIQSALPAASGEIIDGRTQPGYSGTPLIEIDGTLASVSSVFDMALNASGSEVYALAITRFAGYGLGAFNGSIVQGCHIGVDASGMEARPNFGGVRLNGSYLGGSSPGEGNIITASPSYAVDAFSGGSAPSHINGNIFGGNKTMTAVLGHPSYHVFVSYNRSSATSIGAAAANVFMGGQIAISSFYSDHVAIKNNYIGMNPSGQPFRQISNLAVEIHMANDTLVESNFIYGGGTGVVVSGTALRNIITRNEIDTEGLGIDLGGCCPYNSPTLNDHLDGDTGPNNYMNAPQINRVASPAGSSTTTVSGLLHSVPNRTYTIELFASDTCTFTSYGPGQRLIRSFHVTTDGNGNGFFTETVPFLPVGTIVTGTATFELEGTSEFSMCKAAEGAGVFGISVNGTSSPLEGDSTTIGVSRSNGTVGTATVNWTATGNTATAGVDFTPLSGSLTFNDGENFLTFPIQTIEDALFEMPESLTITLTGSTGAAIGSFHSVQLEIQNDDDPPQLSAPPATEVTEGDSGTTTATVTFTLAQPAGAPIVVSYHTVNNTATSGSGDYVHASSQVTIPAGSTQASVDLHINGDTFAEANESFFLFYAAYAGGTTRIDILNDDTPAEVSIAPAQLPEGNSGQSGTVVHVTANKPLFGTVLYTMRAGSASAGSDYIDDSGVLTFNGESAKTIQVVVNGDTDPEANEQFFVELTHQSGQLTLVNDEAAVTILNDDAGVGPAQQWIAAGESGTYAIVLGAPASSDATITLTSSSPEVVSVPSTITVPAGTTDLAFDARALLPGATATITVTFPASLGGSSKTVDAFTYLDTNIVLQPAELQLFIGQTAAVRVSLSPAAPAPVNAVLSFNSAVLTAPSQITIPAGGEASFEVTAVGAGPIFLHVILPASYGEKRATVLGQVLPPPDGPAITTVTPGSGPSAGARPSTSPARSSPRTAQCSSAASPRHRSSSSARR